LFVLADSVTLPENPLMLLKTMRTVPVEPGGKVIDPGLTSNAKLVTVRGSVTVWVMEPLWAFSVNRYDSGIALLGDVMVILEMDELPGETLGLFGFIWTPNPPAETVAESETGPLKPFRLVSVIVEEADPPWTVVKDVGLVEIVKSGATLALTSRMAECVREPLVAVTVTV
jgi:hypothetical protein